MSGAHYPLLETINDPADLRQLDEADLSRLVMELRGYLLDSLARSGGHLAASLGTAELTVALHYVFNTPWDRLIWDVGHQAYGHKILTGRRDQLGTIRKNDGLAPFTHRDESVFDPFGAGHSSTSISAALGMAIASRAQGQDRKVVAVIGDGGMTAGLAYEALEHAGELHSDVLVVLNDNKMSISPNVGAMHNYLTRVLSGRVYSTLREGSKKVLSHMPPVWELARRTEEHVKGMVVPGSLFEELGFNYFGPIDGHDMETLVKTLRNLRNLEGPRLLHVVTRKGKGYAPAEADPVAYHGVGPFDPKVGLPHAKTGGNPTYTQVFGEWLCDMAEADSSLMAITPAMCEGSGMVNFAKRFPGRYFDVGIAEQHSVTLAAGMAAEGLRPVVAIYSTFLQRAYDQLIHDVALQKLPVVFAIDRAGIVGPDGATHGGLFDFSFLRCVPNMVVMAPADENECRHMLYTAHRLNGPAAVRYPRGTGPGVPVSKAMVEFPIGKAEVRRRGARVALLAFGAMVEAAEIVGHRIDATVVNMRFVKPIDESLILELAETHEFLVTVEDNVVSGGAGSAVSECLARGQVTVPICHCGIPDEFVDHGDRNLLLAECGLDSDGIFGTIEEFLRTSTLLSEKAGVRPGWPQVVGDSREHKG